MNTRTFADLPIEASCFFRELRHNNTKSWFEKNKERYEDRVQEPALRFAEALAVTVAEFSPHIAAEPRVGGSVFRIQRDVRFSSDKTPYKTHIGIRLRDQRFRTGAKCEGPLYYMELDDRTARFGIGVKTFIPAELQAYRQALGQPASFRMLERIVAAAEKSGGSIRVESLKRIPEGMPDAALSLFKGLFAWFDAPIADVGSGDLLLREATKCFRRNSGLYGWLIEWVSVP